MDFYKKLSFSILAFIFCFAVMIKLVEPVIERQISNITNMREFISVVKIPYWIKISLYGNLPFIRSNELE